MYERRLNSKLRYSRKHLNRFIVFTVFFVQNNYAMSLVYGVSGH